MTATTYLEPARVFTLPSRPTPIGGPVAVGSVLAEVLPLVTFRPPARPQSLATELSRRSAALAAIGAWRRAHPDAQFEQDFAAAERISREFGV